ncbi:mercuric reductase [Candidatus Caldarchaeum subterraneum]|uniref:Mercuric reductase n=2 Tax=Caldiarchaeum subterraneum TaxID=311458 RepID=E6N6W6_CALS0|nr:mercuric reductase [Candidatus Caldarchaeum subterraneum]BAJ50835.1 mercuric reductase [Candidatus Caldarchaeum subterraneum]
MNRYELVIIGGGAAAFSAAIKASELTENKLSILMISAGKLGGTCVNVGCVPSKYLIEAAKHYHSSHTPLFDGVTPKGADLDFGKLMESLRRFVDVMRGEKYADVLKHYPNVELIEGRGSFTSPHTIAVETRDGVREVEFEKALIATGSRPAIPNIPGLEKNGYYTTDTIWDMDTLPENTLLVGRGAVGLEIGQAMQRLGSQVTLVELLDRILPNMESEISSTLSKILADEGMRIMTKARVVEFSRHGDLGQAEIVTNEGRQTIEFDAVLIATGRKPNTDRMGLEKSSVAVDNRGFIKVDETMRTSSPNIYAAGDCIAKPLMLETLSAREGVVAASNIVEEGSAAMDYGAVPLVVFTEPQVASVGLTEREVVKRFGACSCRVVSLKNVAKARMTGGRGLAKLVINPNDGRVLGVHIVSPNAAEYITEAALYIKYGKKTHGHRRHHTRLPNIRRSPETECTGIPKTSGENELLCRMKTLSHSFRIDAIWKTPTQFQSMETGSCQRTAR